MAGSVGDGLKWLESAGNGCNGWNWLDMALIAGNDSKQLKWLEMPENGYKLLKMAGNGWKIME